MSLLNVTENCHTLVLVTLVFVISGIVYNLLRPGLKQRREGQKLGKDIDGISPHWLFGHLQQLKPNQKTILEICELTKKFPKIGQLWFGPVTWYLMLIHPHVLKPILTIPERKDDMAYRFIQPWIGEGLLTSSGKKWHRNRHLLTRAFHFDVLKEYTKVFNHCAVTLLEKWENSGGEMPIEIYKDVSLMALDSMMQCAISCKTECQTIGSESKYISAVYDLTTIAMKRVFNPLCHNDLIFSLTPSGRKFKVACDYIHQYDEKVIEERKRNLEKIVKLRSDSPGTGNETVNSNIGYVTTERIKHGGYLDFLDILLLTRDEDGRGLGDREIRDEVDTFLFEGHDTTASGMSWALYCLAAHPDLQERCREEVMEVLGDRQEVEWKDLSKLLYMTLFIKEVLRLYPPVFAIARKTTSPVVFDRGFGEDQHCLDDSPIVPGSGRTTIHSGTNVGIPIIGLHRNETLWNNPSNFDPSRFETKNASSRSPFAYIPFSAGPRNCIGQNFAMAEMKVVLARALMRLRFSISEQCPAPEIFPMIVLKSTNGIQVVVEKL